MQPRDRHERGKDGRTRGESKERGREKGTHTEIGTWVCMYGVRASNVCTIDVGGVRSHALMQLTNQSINLLGNI